jgi:hypothetical protein
MPKQVSVTWRSGGAEIYKGVAKIEEDRNYEQHVTGWRLYDAEGQLITLFSHDVVSHVEVSEKA